jgi:exodeoxyribonuclease III
VRIATWNINSLRARQERVEEWIGEVQPDILLLQETKLADDAFPALAFQALGYSSAHYGQGQWNGVAILSRVGIDEVVTNFAGGVEPDPDARIITATCGGLRVSSVYVPNGRALQDDHYAYKLSWLDRLLTHLGADADPAGSVVVGGDFNIAPDDRDVWDPARLVGATHVSQPERDRLAALYSWGLVDVFREQHADDRVFSWWDYRAGDFHQGRGMRIDLVLGSAPVAARVEWCVVDRNARKGKQPSDHAPVIVDLAD